MDLERLQIEVGMWSDRNFPNNRPHHPLLGALEELGELSHAHLKMEQGIRGNVDQHHYAKLDAIGDIIIYLADYCHRNSLELAACVEITWEMVKKRNWQANKQDGTV